MRYNYILAIIGICFFGLTSCSSGDDDGTTQTPEPPVEEKEWVKDNTINVYFVSSLKDESANSQEDAIINYFNQLGDKCSVGIVERTDAINFADQASAHNSSTAIAFNTRRFSAFALHKYNSNNIEGSTILFNHKINGTETKPITSDCYMKYAPVQAKTIASKSANVLLPLATVRFSTSEQINSSADALIQLGSNSYKAVIIGSVKTELASALKEKIEGTTTMKVSLVSDYADDYTIFVAARSSWVLRETKMETVGSVKGFTLAIESGV